MLLTNATQPYGCRKPGWPCVLDADNPEHRAIDPEITAPHDPSVRCGHYVSRWIERHCVATQGHWVKKAAGVLDWERDYFIELFSVNPELGVRQYRWALLGTPKKSGKTEICGWLGNYGLIGDEEPSPVIGVAASAEHQADLVFGAASKCATWSPTLSQLVKPYEGHIEVPDVAGSELKRLSSKSGTNDGPSWHMLLLDELHTWEGKAGRDLWTVLTNGVGARLQPLIVQITTAGVDLEETVCGEQYELGLELLENPELDPRYLFWWYQAREGDDWRDPATWKDANPSWGYTLPNPEEYLGDQLIKKRESEFKRYFLNLWVPSEEAWLPEGAWDDCEGHVRFKRSLPLYVGIDGALKRDSFAVVALQRQKEGIVVQAKVWENPYPKNHPRYESWKLNLDQPLNYCRKLFNQFQEAAVVTDTEAYPGPAFAYDPAYLEYAAQTLEGDGLHMVEIPQTDAQMCPASEKLFEIITKRELIHNGDARLKRHVHAATAVDRTRGSWRLMRPKGTRRKIDALSAMLCAIRVAFRQDTDDIEELEGPGLW